MDFKAAQDEAKAYWQDVLQELNADAGSFGIKKEYKGKVSIYPQEFNHDTFYVEFRNQDWNPLASRKLVKFTPPENFTEVYEAGGRFGDYFVPVTEFTDVILQKKDIEAAKLSDLPDIPLMDMTARDLFAVLHGVPASKKGWLNTLIKSNKIN